AQRALGRGLRLADAHLARDAQAARLGPQPGPGATAIWRADPGHRPRARGRGLRDQRRQPGRRRPAVVIEVEALHKRFAGQVALEEVNFIVPRGEIFGFVGPNGAGKTTTIRILATLAVPDAGTATIGGIKVDDDPHAVRELIGYMPDFFGVYDRLTAEEYL